MVGHSIDRYGKKAGIAEDYLIEALGGRVALVCGTHVACKHEPQRRQVLHKIDCRPLAQFITLNTGEVVTYAVMAQGQSYLLGHQFEERGCLLAEIVANIKLLQPVPDEVSRIEQPSSPVHDVHNGLS